MQGKAAAAIHPSSRWRTGSSQCCLRSMLAQWSGSSRKVRVRSAKLARPSRCTAQRNAAALDAPTSCSRQEQQSALMHATVRGARRCGALSRRISLLRRNFCTPGVLRSKRAAQRMRRRSTPPPRVAARTACSCCSASAPIPLGADPLALRRDAARSARRNADYVEQQKKESLTAAILSVLSSRGGKDHSALTLLF